MKSKSWLFWCVCSYCKFETAKLSVRPNGRPSIKCEACGKIHRISREMPAKPKRRYTRLTGPEWQGWYRDNVRGGLVAITREEASELNRRAARGERASVRGLRKTR